MPTYDFPQDLRDAQLALPQSRAAFEQYAIALPWSAAPMPGWEADEQLHSTYRSGKPDSPAYTQEEAAEVARYQAELLRPSIEVSTHPYWSTLDNGVVGARFAR
ncbi:hypothetical protein [Streptomyces sp. NPDC005181]|uniref:hypothetical protein n=1 Tax=Streptomyces sp. NPDC005181 TaxID=3156869 RepID=UPI0033ABBEC0